MLSWLKTIVFMLTIIEEKSCGTQSKQTQILMQFPKQNFSWQNTISLVSLLIRWDGISSQWLFDPLMPIMQNLREQIWKLSLEVNHITEWQELLMEWAVGIILKFQEVCSSCRKDESLLDQLLQLVISQVILRVIFICFGTQVIVLCTGETLLMAYLSVKEFFIKLQLQVALYTLSTLTITEYVLIKMQFNLVITQWVKHANSPLIEIALIETSK